MLNPRRAVAASNQCLAHDVPAEMINHHLINGGLRAARVDEVIGTVCLRLTLSYTLCETRPKFNQLDLRLSKAFIQYADAFLLF